MRLHALLSWFDEPPGQLAACVASLKLAGVDHVIGIDGAYELFPDGKPSSPPDQPATIHMTCQALGIATTIHTPQTRWAGNEVEKRTRLFDIAHATSDPGDWWFVIDADEVVLEAPADLKQQLEQTERHAATATLVQLRNLDATQAASREFNYARQGQYPLRMLFKAQRIRCRTNHYTYVTEDDRILWASDSGSQEPCVAIPDLVVEHRDTQRALDRVEKKELYYKRRRITRIEFGECVYKDRGCNEAATKTIARRFRVVTNEDGTKGAVAELGEACERHAREIDGINRRWLLQHGVNPDNCRSEIRDPMPA